MCSSKFKDCEALFTAASWAFLELPTSLIFGLIVYVSNWNKEDILPSFVYLVIIFLQFVFPDLECDVSVTV